MIVGSAASIAGHQFARRDVRVDVREGAEAPPGAVQPLRPLPDFVESFVASAHGCVRATTSASRVRRRSTARSDTSERVGTASHCRGLCPQAHRLDVHELEHSTAVGPTGVVVQVVELRSGEFQDDVICSSRRVELGPRHVERRIEQLGERHPVERRGSRSCGTGRGRRTNSAGSNAGRPRPPRPSGPTAVKQRCARAGPRTCGACPCRMRPGAERGSRAGA